MVCVAVLPIFLLVLPIMVFTTEMAHGEPLIVRSAAFVDGGDIPKQYTCEGEDISPPIAWSSPGWSTKSFVLTVDDPDAPRGTWNHWYLYNIPPSVTQLPEAASSNHLLPVGSIEALNDFKRHAYGGPCPPSGRHRYIFVVRALDRIIEGDNHSRAAVENRIQGHVIAEGRLLGYYKKSQREAVD
jgi:Raf kinase inhibitor-like YbhB/YbcL family protein